MSMMNATIDAVTDPLAKALHHIKIVIADRPDNGGIVLSIWMLRALVDAIDQANAGDMLVQLMAIRKQHEDVIAALRALCRDAEDDLADLKRP